MDDNKAKQFIKSIFQGSLFVLGAILLALCLRIFLFTSFKIPSPSMEPAIMAGDYILVNKLIPGTRVFKNLDFMKGAQIETKRFKGVRTIKRNDVLVFNFPYKSDCGKIEMDLNVNYVKRCIAIPGDTFYIDNGIYKIKNCSGILGQLVYQENLSKMSDSEFRQEIWNSFPYDTLYYRWNIKNFGLLYVPGKGDNVTIDTINYCLYKNLIEYETDKRVIIQNGLLYLEENEFNSYTFQQNYYFMSGDWVFDSHDSRYWGLLPEDHIIGKAAFVWKSKDIHTRKYNWKRFFTKIK